MSPTNRPHLSTWGTIDHSQGPLLSLTQDGAPLTTHLANGNQFGPRSKARDNGDREFLEGRRNMMTKYNHSPSSRFFHGARSPEGTFQLSRKETLSPKFILRAGSPMALVCKGTNWALERWRDSPVTPAGMEPTPQCTTGGGDCSPCEAGPAPALFLFSHFV